MRKILYSGIFDLLHIGHVSSMMLAKSFGDFLVVHVASDQETRGVKGLSRPVIDGYQRAELIRNLKCVDKVIYKDYFLSLPELLDMVKPDILFLNLCGNPENAEEECKKRGISIVKVPNAVPTDDDPISATKIIRKIKDSAERELISGSNFALIDKDAKEILLQKRDKRKDILCPGMWCIPGGGLEKGEDPLMGVTRELNEETGLTTSPRVFDVVCDWHYSWGDVNRIFYAFINRDIKNQIKGTEGKMVWFSFDEAKKLELADNQNKLLKVIIERFYGR